MHNAVNFDAVVEHLKNIVDCIRCPVCDKADGTRMRYACGHQTCEDCVDLAVECSVCLTPPETGARKPVVDKTFSQRAADAVNLLNVFQNEFHIDVYKRDRISDQLKVEKEVFPECIQAPAKYFNKRKSFRNSKPDKENRLSQLPGEEVSSFTDYKMNKRNQNVEIWLDKFVRKPFAELNSNDDSLRSNTRTIKKQYATNNENVVQKRSNRKRTHSNTLSLIKNQNSILDHLTPEKKAKRPNKEYKDISKVYEKPDTSKYSNTKADIKSDNTESGTGMEDEAVIVIDDSQSIKIDKDKNAWLAVLEAERNKFNDSTSTFLFNIRSIAPTPIKETLEAENDAKVPFYLKGYFSNKCIDCNRINVPESMIRSVNNDANTTSDKNVSITVENKSFITVINIRQQDNKQSTNKTNCMQSVEVQTETIESIVDNDKKIHESQSQHLIQDERSENADIHMIYPNKVSNVIIQESDSDEDIEASTSLEVIADVHKSCEEVDYTILADVDDLDEHSKRARRAPRGVTPTSSNSSEKENYNPNRMRRPPPSKKKPMKK